MWIVKLALRRPYTFVVMALLIMILGGTAIVTMPVDIFPYIDIPILSIIYQYNGLSPEEMANRVVTNFERGLTTSVNDIEHIESQSYNGVAVIRVYFHPGARIELAQAQVVANAQANLRGMPPGMFPPNILKYDVSSVPVLQIGAFRLRQRLHPDTAGDHSGRHGTESLRRQIQEHHRRSRPRRHVRQTGYGERRIECDGAAEPD